MAGDHGRAISHSAVRVTPCMSFCTLQHLWVLTALPRKPWKSDSTLDSNCCLCVHGSVSWHWLQALAVKVSSTIIICLWELFVYCNANPERAQLGVWRGLNPPLTLSLYSLNASLKWTRKLGSDKLFNSITYVSPQPGSQMLDSWPDRMAAPIPAPSGRKDVGSAFIRLPDGPMC